MWLLEDHKYVVSRNIMFREDKVLKDIRRGESINDDKKVDTKIVDTDLHEDSGLTYDILQGGAIT